MMNPKYSVSADDVKAFRDARGCGLKESYNFMLKQKLVDSVKTADIEELREIVAILIEEVL